MRQPLTKRQHEILTFVTDFIGTRGFAPSLEEIGEHHGLSSLATVSKHLANLQRKGHIKRAWNLSRSIELIGSPGCCPTCGRAFDSEAKAS